MEALVAENTSLAQDCCLGHTLMEEVHIPAAGTRLGGGGNAHKAELAEFLKHNYRASEVFAFAIHLNTDERFLLAMENTTRNGESC